MPYVDLTIEGVPLSGRVSTVTLEESDSGADQANISLIDGEGVLADVLQEGMEVALDLGSFSLHAQVFRGLLTRLSATYSTAGNRLEIEAHDALIRMNGVPCTRAFRQTDLASIVQQLARCAALQIGRIDILDPPQFSALRPCQQVEETDLAFLNRLAREFDCRMYIDHDGGDTLHFVSTERLLEADAIESALVLGQNLSELEASVEAFAAGRTLRLVTTDQESGQRIESLQAFRKRESWTPDVKRLAMVGPESGKLMSLFLKGGERREQALRAWGEVPREVGSPSGKLSDMQQGRGNAARVTGLTARGQADGDILLRPRRCVMVHGCGGRWSGSWYLAKVTHELNLSERDYRCSFVCTR